MKMFLPEKIRFGIFFFFFLLAGCARPKVLPIVTPSATTILAPSVTATLFPTNPFSPTLTSSPTPTNTSIPSPSLTPTLSGFQWSEDAPVWPCISISPNLPAGLHLSGLVLGAGFPMASLIGVLDPNNGARIDQLIPYQQGRTLYNYHLSPDGKWMAYELQVLAADKSDDKTSRTIVVEPAGNILTNSSKGRIIVYQSNSPINLIGWLNNTAVAIALDPREFGQTIIHNPFTGQEYTFSFKQIPDFWHNKFTEGYIFGASDLIPDPTLTRVVYIADHTNKLNAALWNTKNKKSLDGFDIVFQTFPPGWSLDGSDFIMQGYSPERKTEWFQMTRDGSVRQLTHFGAWFGAASRSWDGRYLAFWIGSSGRSLVMDLKSKTERGFCLARSLKDEDSFHNLPVWSPDDKYVIFSDGEKGIPGDWVLVDVKKQEAYVIAKDVPFYAVGWMDVDEPLPVASPTPQ